MLLPKIILEVLTNPKLSLSDVSLNHVFILCSKEQKESVRKYFIEQYILIRISEIDKLLENYDSVSLYGREYDLRQYRTEIVRQISSIIFRQIDKIDAGILAYFKEILAKMTENLSKDGVQSRQAVFVRCCLKF